MGGGKTTNIAEHFKHHISLRGKVTQPIGMFFVCSKNVETHFFFTFTLPPYSSTPTVGDITCYI